MGLAVQFGRRSACKFSLEQQERHRSDTAIPVIAGAAVLSALELGAAMPPSARFHL
jgi:hypothetical protein